MAFGRDKRSGYDISGVGRGRSPLTNSGMPQGLSFAGDSRSGRRRANGRASIPKQVPGSSLDSGGRSMPRARSVLTALLVAILAIGIAVGVGALVYQQALRSSLKPEIDDGSLRHVLAPANSLEESQWMLLVHTDAAAADDSRGNIVDLGLAFMDADNSSFTVLWIPPETRTYVAGYGYQTLNEAFGMNGESALVSAVSGISNVAPAHYFEVSDAGYEKYLEAASIGASGTRDEQLRTILKALFGSSNEQLPVAAETLCKYVACDLSDGQLASMLGVMQGTVTDEAFSNAEMPQSTPDEPDAAYALVNAEAWGTMVERVSSGRTPVAQESEIRSNETMRSSYNITIWNGVGVNGIASDCADHLKSLGWHIESTGNAASFVYDETLVVYKYDNDEALADLVVSDLGQGRAVRSAARYSFEGRILVVVGKNYQPY